MSSADRLLAAGVNWVVASEWRVFKTVVLCIALPCWAANLLP
jgi:hypothetical protein